MSDFSRRMIAAGVLGTLSFIGGTFISHSKEGEKQSLTQQYHIIVEKKELSEFISMSPIDFDGDGDMDLAIVKKCGFMGMMPQPTETRLYFLRNDGKGNFDLVSQPPRGYEPERK